VGARIPADRRQPAGLGPEHCGPASGPSMADSQLSHAPPGSATKQNSCGVFELLDDRGWLRTAGFYGDGELEAVDQR